MELEKEIEDVVTQIRIAKGRGKHCIKVKVYQATLSKKVGHPTGIYIKTGMYENGAGEKALKDMGYSISYEREKRYNKIMTKEGLIPNGDVLNTTVMTVRW